MINPEGFGKMISYFCEIESKRQTHQKHADCMVVQYDLHGRNSIKRYIDVKSYTTMGVDKSRVSLYHPTPALAKKLSNDLIISLKKVIVDKKIIDLIANLNIPFNVFLNESLVFFQKNNPKLEIYPLVNKVKKDVRITDELSNIYRTLPEKNKMLFLNYLLHLNIESKEK